MCKDMVLIRKISDPENGVFREIGTVVHVLSEELDPMMPSGKSYKVDLGHEIIYFVDKYSVLPLNEYGEIAKAIVSSVFSLTRQVGVKE